MVLVGHSFKVWNCLYVVVAAIVLLTTPSRAFTSLSRAIVKPCSSSSSSCSSSRIFSSAAGTTTELVNGLVKKVSQPGRGGPITLGDMATIKYSCYIPGEDKSPPFAKADRQKMIVGDGSMVIGWEKAIRTMAVGERAIIRISDPSLGYGAAGVPPLVPPNSELEFDIEILDTQPAMANIDFDSLANADNTPRTAATIQAAYEVRQAIKALEGPPKEGLEGWIEKAKGYYFFGLFEGETGQQAPWFLRPSITFPIAFLIVGAAFAVSYATGSIYERGAAVTDELDEFIISSVMTNPSTVLAMMMATLPLDI